MVKAKGKSLRLQVTHAGYKSCWLTVIKEQDSISNFPKHYHPKLFAIISLPATNIYPRLPWWLSGKKKKKNPPANAGDMGLIPGLERSAKEGSDKPLQFYCLENSMDRKNLKGYSPQGRKRVRYNLVTK